MNSKFTQTSDRIFAPNVYIFAYSLREGAEGAANPLWKQGDKIVSYFSDETLTPKLDFPASGTGAPRADLLEDTRFDFTSTKDAKIEGFAQPQQLQDSYALWLNIGYSDEGARAENAAEVQVLRDFNPNDILVSPVSPPTEKQILGQVVLIVAWLTPETQEGDFQYLRSIADKCYRALFGKEAPLFSRAGELFASTIFEYGEPKQLADNLGKSQVFVWLLRDKKADDQYGNYQQELIALFFYRTKIIKAFQDSRLVYASLDREYSQIEQNLDSIQTNLDSSDAASNDAASNHAYLDDFKTQLKQLSRDSLQYTRLLRKLEDYGTTIEINLYNYNKQIAQIGAALEADKEEISFLEHFGRETAPHFRRQIEADLGYFEHGTELVDRAIASIRGIVEIDQAKRDRDRQQAEKERDRQEQEQRQKNEESARAEQKRQEDFEKNLQDQIQAIGVGVGAGAIVASTAGLIFQQPIAPIAWPWKGDRLHPFTIAVLLSAACAILFWAGAKWGLPWLFRQRR